MNKKIENDITSLERLCLKNSMEVMEWISKMQKFKDRNIHLAEDCSYLYIEGDKKYPALVAHADTVREIPKVYFESISEFFYDQEKKVLWSPNLAGFDDRAGIFAILKLSQEYDFPIIILNQEEVGGNGALKFCEDFFQKEQFKYFIELDRQGRDDSVFYDCHNSFFEYYINSFGFKTAKGTFSDIFFLAPYFDCAAVNLSIGYVDEHCLTERLYLEDFYETIERVKHILETADKAPKFLYF